jgi:RimJ/RimL family protein N-acetyltransferase/CheY-like chemotaxis protein
MTDSVAILDHDARVRHRLAALLSSLGIRATALADATSMQHALQTERQRPGVLLLDGQLASMLGGEFFRQVPTVVLHDSSAQPAADRFLAQGAAAVVHKPLETWNLLAELQRILPEAPGLKAALPRSIVLDDGRAITIRAIQPEDAGIEQDFVRSLSLAAKQRRFFFPVKELSEKLLHEFTHPQYPDNWALIATVRQQGAETEIGVARYAPCRGSAGAEFAVVVADAWQGCGVATHLMLELLEVAAEANIRLIEGNVLRENRRMLAFIERLGFVPQPHPDDPAVVRVVKVLDLPG